MDAFGATAQWVRERASVKSNARQPAQEKIR